MTNTLLEPAPAPARPVPTTRTGWRTQFRRDNVYLLPVLSVAVPAFTVVVSALVFSASLVVLWVGLPMLAVALRVAGGFADVERVRLRALGLPFPAPGSRANRPGGYAGILRDRGAWLDLLHAIVTFPTAVMAWSLTVVWWAGALGGLSYPLWQWTLPDGPDNQNLAELLGITSTPGDIALNLAIGAAFALTIVPVLRGLAGAQSGLSRAVLAPDHVGTER